MRNRIGGVTPFLTMAAVAATFGFALAAAPAQAGELRWSGDVDDTATIYVTGRDVRLDATLKGVSNERRRVQGALTRGDSRVQLRREDGRGRVEIVQQPNARNNYTAAVRIRDTEPGKHHYAFVLQWDDRNNGNGRGNRDRDDDRGRRGRQPNN